MTTPADVQRGPKIESQIKSNLLTSLQSLGIVSVMFVMAFSCRDGVKKSTTAFDPYKGTLNELLKPEMSSGLIKFKLSGAADTSSYGGSTEAKGFTYMQEAAGVSIKVDGALINYPTASQADAKIAELARKSNVTLTKKSGGQRFSSPDGKTVVWTNGSLLCVVASSFPRPATNFEQAAPF
jgi:hypothetical protein